MNAGSDYAKLFGMAILIAVVFNSRGIHTATQSQAVPVAVSAEVVEVPEDPDAPTVRTQAIDLEALLRQLQPALEKVEPAPVVPLGIELQGPRDALVGDPIWFTAKTRGDVSQFKWSVETSIEGRIVPMDQGLIETGDDARRAFTNRQIGQYRITVSVSGKDGQVAHDVETFEILAQPSVHAITAANVAQRIHEPSLMELAEGWLSSVPGATRNQEARQLTTIMRELAAIYREGGAMQSEDPLREIQGAFEEAIGPAAYHGWNTFFDGEGYMRHWLADLQSKGGVGSSESWANTLENLAVTIESLSQ